MAADHQIQPLAGERFLPVSRGLDALGALLDAAPRRAAPTLVLDVEWRTYQVRVRVRVRVRGRVRVGIPPPRLPRSRALNIHGSYLKIRNSA